MRNNTIANRSWEIATIGGLMISLVSAVFDVAGRYGPASETDSLKSVLSAASIQAVPTSEFPDALQKQLKDQGKYFPESEGDLFLLLVPTGSGNPIPVHVSKSEWAKRKVEVSEAFARYLEGSGRGTPKGREIYLATGSETRRIEAYRSSLAEKEAMQISRVSPRRNWTIIIDSVFVLDLIVFTCFLFGAFAFHFWQAAFYDQPRSIAPIRWLGFSMLLLTISLLTVLAEIQTEQIDLRALGVNLSTGFGLYGLCMRG